MLGAKFEIRSNNTIGEQWVCLLLDGHDQVMRPLITMRNRNNLRQNEKQRAHDSALIV